MKSLKSYLRRGLRERIEEEDIFVINEGIDLEWDNLLRQGLVSYNPGHERLVNTSAAENPTVEELDGVPVWSVFKRNKNGRDKQEIKADGNPLVRAFKNDGVWKFKSQKDKERILAQMSKILKKFDSEHKYAGTVLVPTTSRVNAIFVEEYKKINPDLNLIRSLLLKLTTDQVFEYVSDPRSKFCAAYKKGAELDKALDLFCGFLDIMDEENGGYFSYHKVEDPKMRNLIEKTLTIANDGRAKYGDMINGKDILIIDDSISRGATLRQAVSLIKEYFMPKSITILTMFSGL